MIVKSLGDLQTELIHLDEQIEGCDESIPSQLALQIELLCKYLRVIGDVQSHYVFLYKRAYAERKAKQGYVLNHHQGTGKEKEGQAERESFQKRVSEGRYEADMVRWSNAYQSTRELIQAKKKTLEILKYELWGVHGD